MTRPVNHDDDLIYVALSKANKLNAEKGVAGGIATLGDDGKVPSSQIPTFTDDVVYGYYNTEDGEFYEDEEYTTPIEGENDKIYIDLTSKNAYAWTEDGYVKISQPLTFDSEPTQGSANPVTSGGVYTALAGKSGVITFTDEEDDGNVVMTISDGGD